MIGERELLLPAHEDNWRIEQARVIKVVVVEYMFVLFELFELAEHESYMQNEAVLSNLQCSKSRL